MAVDVVETEELTQQARDFLAASGADLTPAGVAAALREQGRPVGDATVLAVFDALRRELRGAGSLEGLLRLTGVTDVLVNGADQVYIDRGNGLEQTAVTFPDEAAVRRLAQRLAASAGRRLDDSSPFVDARLTDGTRLHAVLEPLARPGTSISLRVPSRRHFTLTALEEAGMLCAESRRLMERVLAARVAFLISGGTGSGKTTLLGAMLGAVPAAERIVIVEDSSELRPEHPHVLGLEARPANVEGAGQITVQQLVRQALRMRPDRLVVGEVRGHEVRDLLAALNTGHEGGCGTLHANSAVDVPARIEALATAGGMSRESAHSQLISAVQVLLHLGRDFAGRRILSDISVLEFESGQVRVVNGVRRQSDGSLVAGPGIEGLHRVLR